MVGGCWNWVGFMKRFETRSAVKGLAIAPLGCPRLETFNSSHLSESPGELATPGHLSHTCLEALMRLGRGEVGAAQSSGWKLLG